MQNPVILAAKPSQPPRRSYTKAFKADIVAQCERGDRSLAQVAMEHQINANLVRKWQHQFRAELNAQNLVPVQIDSAPRSSTSSNFVEIELGSLALKIHGMVDSAYITSLVRALQ